MAFVQVANMGDLWEGEKLGVSLAGRWILLVHVSGRIRAYEDRCPHKGVRLSPGELSGHVLRCQAHHWAYDVRTGQGINPQSAALRRLPVRVVDGAILVDPGLRTAHGI